jgi:hypothetical protein
VPSFDLEDCSKNRIIMCDSIDAKHRHLRIILQPRHRSLTVFHLPNQLEFAGDLYRVLTNAFFPPAILLAMYCVLKDELENGELGIYGDIRAVVCPLCIVDIDGDRYKTPVMEALHGAVPNLLMSDRVSTAVDEVCHKHGVARTRNCSCGEIMAKVEDTEKVRDSYLIKSMDAYRSGLDRKGMPIIPVETLDEIPANIDLTASELRMFGKIEAIMRDITDDSQIEFPIHSQLAFIEGRRAVQRNAEVRQRQTSRTRETAVLV